jgi:membrane associated rhomboid family serine protease
MSGLRPTGYDPGFGGGESNVQSHLALPRLTPMVKRLLIVNALVWVATFLVWLKDPAWGGAVQSWLGANAQQWRELFPFVPFWQLFTHGFLHDSTDLLHILWNSLLLYFFGTIVEGLVGPNRFLVTYLLAMLSGAVLFLVVKTMTGSNAFVVGASGAIFGVLVAAAAMRPDTQVILLFVPVKLKWLAIGLFAIDLVRFLTAQRTGMSGHVALEAHIGGAIYGFLAVKQRWIWWDPLRKLEIRRAIAAEEKRQNDAQRVDALLAKINREGLGALSQRERDFLKRTADRQ